MMRTQFCSFLFPFTKIKLLAVIPRSAPRKSRNYNYDTGDHLLHGINILKGKVWNETHSFLKNKSRASLVPQWLRVRLPVRGTRVRALVWEDSTCRGATKPVRHNYWACASGACAPQGERPQQWEARAPWWRVAPTRHNWRKPSHRNEDPTQPKINNK